MGHLMAWYWQRGNLHFSNIKYCMYFVCQSNGQLNCPFCLLETFKKFKSQFCFSLRTDIILVPHKTPPDVLVEHFVLMCHFFV